MVKPNLFIVGAAKSGTTSLANYLGQHPQIFMSPLKEPFFFTSYCNLKDEHEYLGLFESVKNETVIAEASTGYLFEKEAAERIKKFSPTAKIIIILRDPINMAYSYWRFMQIDGNEQHTFEQAISDEERAFRKTDAFKGAALNWWASYLYLERAKYLEQVDRYFRVFGAENVRLFIFEDFVRTPHDICTDIFRFIDVDPNYNPKISILNEGGELRFKSIAFHAFHRVDFAPRTRRLLKLMIRVGMREKIRHLLRRLNTNKKKPLQPMKPETRNSLIDFFKDDVMTMNEKYSLNLKDKWPSYFEACDNNQAARLSNKRRI